MPKTDRRSAFTLIELLVVIAIIALLLSIIVPSLKKAKYYARLVIDRNNLKSLGMATQLYLNSSKDRFFNYPAPETPNYLWLQMIGDQVGNVDDVRFCPETKAKVQDVENSFDTDSIWGTSANPWLWNTSSIPGKRYEMGSYGINGWLYADCEQWVPATMTSYPFKNRAGVKIPYMTPLFLECIWVDSWPENTNVLPATGYNYSEGDRAHGTSTTAIGRFVMDRHGPETNAVFLDGHAETIPHAALWTLSWHAKSRPNNNPVIPKPIPQSK